MLIPHKLERKIDQLLVEFSRLSAEVKIKIITQTSSNYITVHPEIYIEKKKVVLNFQLTKRAVEEGPCRFEKQKR